MRIIAAFFSIYLQLISPILAKNPTEVLDGLKSELVEAKRSKERRKSSYTINSGERNHR